MSGGKKPTRSVVPDYYRDGLPGEYHDIIEKNLKSPANKFLIRLILSVKEAADGMVTSLDAPPSDIIAELAKKERGE